MKCLRPTSNRSIPDLLVVNDLVHVWYWPDRDPDAKMYFPEEAQELGLSFMTGLSQLEHGSFNFEFGKKLALAGQSAHMNSVVMRLLDSSGGLS